MPRLLRPLLAVALLTLAAPAAHAAPHGEVVFVGTGTVAGRLTVSRTVGLDFTKARLATKSPYVVLVAVRRGEVVAGTTVTPAFDGHDFPLTMPSEVRAGTSDIRMLANGPVTLTVPATGISGRLVVHLDRKVSGGVAVIHAVPIVANTVRDDIAAHLSPASFTVHGYAATSGENLGNVDVFCVSPQPNDLSCPPGPNVLATSVGREDYYYPEDRLGGDQHAQVIDAQATFGPTFTHYLLSLPLA